MTIRKGPEFDRWLMRAKDMVILGTALWALIKWIYINPIQMQEQLNRQQKILEEISQSLKERKQG